MSGQFTNPYTRLLAAWVRLVTRHARLTILLCLLLTGAAGWFASQTLTVNTSNTDLISPDVPFRINATDYAQAFPQFSNLLLVVLEEGTPEEREASAVQLAAALRQRPDLYRTVYNPSADLHFRRQGLLYLSIEDLETVSDRLAQSQPLIAQLSQDPSLRGLADLLVLALSYREQMGAEEIAPFLSAMTDTVEAQAEGREKRLSWREVLAEDIALSQQQRQFLLVQPRLDPEAFAPADQPLQMVRELAREAGIGVENDVVLHLTGAPALENEELETVAEGLGWAGLLSLTLVTILLIWGLRSAQLIIAVLSPLFVGLILTTAYASISVGQFNLISVAFAVLFVGLSVDFGIHFALRYREAIRSGLEPRRAMSLSADSVGGALTLSAVCAAIGFFAFVPTEYRGLAELGVIAGGSMFIALIANLTLLPAILWLLPLKQQPLRGQETNPFGRGLERLVRRQARTIVLVSGIVGVVSLIAAPQVHFDVNPLNLQDPDAEPVATFLDLVDDPETTPYTINIVADDLEEANRIREAAAQLPIVDRALTLSSFVPAEQDEKVEIIFESSAFLSPLLIPGNGKPEPTPEEQLAALENLVAALRDYVAEEEGPTVDAARDFLAAIEELREKQGLTAEELTELDQRLTATLPNWLDNLRLLFQAEPFVMEDLPAHIARRWITEEGRARVEVYPAVDVTNPDNLRLFAKTLLDLDPRATGTPVIVTEASDAVTRSFITAMAITLVLIVILLAVIQRHMSDVILTLSPLVLAALVLVAVTVFFSMPLNFANIIVLPLLFGLGVSSSIHLVTRRRKLGDEGRLLRSSTPRAVLFSSLTTVASFGSLWISEHRGMSSMGSLLTIAIFLVLLASLLFLPSLMRLLGKPSSRTIEAAE